MKVRKHPDIEFEILAITCSISCSYNHPNLFVCLFVFSVLTDCWSGRPCTRQTGEDQPYGVIRSHCDRGPCQGCGSQDV